MGNGDEPLRERRVHESVTVALVNQRNFATVPEQFYDLIQWMREGCGRERANEDSGENARGRRLHGRISDALLEMNFPRVSPA